MALGGYGRQELFPYSDIDLLILYHSESSENLKEQAAIKKVAEAILYPLWDTGLEVGHGLHTADEAMTHAAQDFFFQVAMLDARFIVGSAGAQDLFAGLLARYRSRFIEGGREEFVRSMKAFERHAGSVLGVTVICSNLIKEGKGGMRDIQGHVVDSQGRFWPRQSV